MAERRRRSRDPLGLRRALSGRLLPGLVAAMSLLAALALAGAHGAAGLAERWQSGAAAAVTVQLPRPDPERLNRALAILRDSPLVAAASPVEPARVAALLRPWLGEAPALPLPGVIELHLRDASLDPAPLAARLAEAVDGAELEAHGLWVARLAALARSVQGIALAALALVAGVAAAVVAVATRAGLAARREAIGILHDLGATRGAIAGRVARRVGLLAAAGAAGGTALAAPALLALARLAAPFAGGADNAIPWQALPWAELLLLIPAAWLIGWGTAQVTVRRWVRRLP
ncbi:cell division protein FtsX [Roseomonas sp. BN140053]|uniref:cell division protein FtsX n=1 Tax=Roseomonas sp. BN140053 TaxID=3391898 RepID=UPI0039E92B20